MNTVVDVELVIRDRYRLELADLHTKLLSDTGDMTNAKRPVNLGQWTPPGITVDSLLDRHTAVTVMATSGDTGEEFPGDTTVAAGRWHILLSVAGHHKHDHRRMPVAQVEADAWAHATLGEWIEHAYRLRDHTDPLLTRFYILFLDNTSQAASRPHTLVDYELLYGPQ